MSTKLNRLVGEVYLHVGNSGAVFEVRSTDNGPTVVVKTGAFGNLEQTTEIKTTRESLRALARLFAKAADAEYKDDYCHAAEYVDLESECSPSKGSLSQSES